MGALTGSPCQEGDSEESHADSREEKLKVRSAKDKVGPDPAEDATLDGKQLDESTGSADEGADVRAKRTKKKPRKAEEFKESRRPDRSLCSEKRNTCKKQRHQDKGRTAPEVEKSPRPGVEERGLQGPDTPEEVSMQLAPDRRLLAAPRTVCLCWGAPWCCGHSPEQ